MKEFLQVVPTEKFKETDKKFINSIDVKTIQSEQSLLFVDKYLIEIRMQPSNKIKYILVKEDGNYLFNEAKIANEYISEIIKQISTLKVP